MMALSLKDKTFVEEKCSPWQNCGNWAGEARQAVGLMAQRCALVAAGQTKAALGGCRAERIASQGA